MKKIILLGASGSIGKQVVSVIKQFPYEFQLIGVSCFSNTNYINSLIKDFPSIEAVGIGDESLADEVNFSNVFKGKDCNIDLLDIDHDALVVNAIGGIDGLLPTIHSIRNNMDLAIANKESIVCGGDLIFDELTKHENVSIFPIDSEHSAIFQCLSGERIEDVDKLIITASGGPYLNTNIRDLNNVTIEQTLKHPTWSMGKKISVDSATMFNKGLEIIEAHNLFGIDYSKIEVLIEPSSTIHSLVEFKDGNIKALLGPKDMRLPISYALSCKREYNAFDKLDTKSLTCISFKQVDNDKFPAVSLAYKVGNIGGSAPMVYCVANEVAVNAYLEGKIKYLEIYEVVNKICESSQIEYNYSLDRLFELIDLTKKSTINLIKQMKGE